MAWLLRVNTHANNCSRTAEFFLVLDVVYGHDVVCFQVTSPNYVRYFNYIWHRTFRDTPYILQGTLAVWVSLQANLISY